MVHIQPEITSSLFRIAIPHFNLAIFLPFFVFNYEPQVSLIEQTKS